MATSGRVETGTLKHSKFYINWQVANTNIAENYHDINWQVGLNCGTSSNWDAWYNNAIKINSLAIDGNTVISNNTFSNVSGAGDHELTSGTTRIYHNSDGSKSFNINLSGWLYTYGNTSGSDNFTLDTIPRASQPSCITYPQTTEDVGAIGGTITIHMNRKSEAFTHTVRYNFGNLNEQIATNVTNNCQWQLPMKLCNQIPSAVSGWGTIYVDTYNGGTYIGTGSVSFKCSVPDTVVPTIGSVTLSETIANINTKFGAFVKEKSKVQVLTGSSGSYGSTVSAIKVEINGASYNTNPCTTDVLKTAGTNNYTVTITDSRNRQARKTGTFNVLDYANPKITTFRITRNDSTPTSATATINATIASVNNKNDKTFTLKYKKKSQSSYTSVNLSNTNYTFNSTYTLTNLDENSSYDIVLEVKDYFGTSSAFADLPTAFSLINYRNTGKGMAFGKVSEKDGLEVGMNTTFYDNLNLTHSPANLGACRETTVQNSWVRLFTLSLTWAWKSCGVMFALGDTQGESNYALCNLYVHKNTYEDQILQIKEFNRIDIRKDFTDRLVAVAVGADKVEVYIKMITNESPTVNIMSMLRLRQEERCGKIDIDCNTVVSSLPSGTAKFSELTTNKYSTSERPIGVWIDGKTIYQKTFQFKPVANSNTVGITHNIANLDNVISYKGSMRMTKTGLDERRFMPQMWYTEMEGFSCSVYTVTDQVMTVAYGDWVKNDANNITMYVTLEYTKK